MNLPLDLPSVAPGQTRPVWTGRGFRIGSEIFPVLDYGHTPRGWSDDLTRFHVERTGYEHSIDIASRRSSFNQIIKHLHKKQPVVLEVGCSSGRMLHMLHSQLHDAVVMGSDVTPGSLKRLSAELPEVPLFLFDVTRCPLPDRSVDVVVMLNVLEHIEDDAEALRQIHRILTPGGIAVFEVPAGPSTYDVYDKTLLHYRRYSMRGLTSLARKQGFTILEKSHLGFFLYPAFWLTKQRNKRYLSADEATMREVVERAIRATKDSRAVKFFFEIENVIGKWISYPFGIRCVLTVARPRQ